MEATQMSTQNLRDTRRVLQVLLPSLPPPALDLCCNVIQQSVSVQQSAQQSREPEGQFRLRRMDRWLDRDTNGCLNFQRIGVSMHRPLELCSWTDHESLGPIGKEYQQDYKLLEEEMAEVAMKRHGRAKQLVVFFGAATIGIRQPGSLTASSSLRAWAQHSLLAKHSKRIKAEQAAEPTQPTKGKGKAANAMPAPQPGRWVYRDCNAALNMQRIGEAKWRPLELCCWPEQGSLPAKGKEYPGLGYKRVQDKPPKAQQQQQQQYAEAQYVCPLS
ncbi:hypothetical protein QJQ45_015581 [Haematococcus lacustris]|nr:hypothetical protein QJQ45_015581 [Haematococcus lacustris]